MAKKVEFREEPYNFIVEGEVTLRIPNSGDWRGIRVTGDKTFPLPEWHLDTDTQKRLEIKRLNGVSHLYLHWVYDDKPRGPILVGSLDNSQKTSQYLVMINARFN